jgi:hypothetical protein
MIRLVALAVIALHLAAYVLPGDLAWGLWPYTSLPPALGWALALIVASLVLYPVNRTVRQGLARAFNALISPVPASPRPAWRSRSGQVQAAAFPLLSRQGVFALAGLLSLPVFWVARLGHLCWGDSFILAKGIANPEVHLTYNWQAPLTVFLHAKLWAAGHGLWGWSDASTAYALTSTLCGGLFIYVLCLMADALGRNRVEKLVIFALVATSGAMALFFGYVENYTIMSLGVVLYLYLGVRCLQGEVDLVWPAIALAFTNAFDPATIVLAPSMLYLFWHHSAIGAGRRWRRASELARLALPFILVALGVLLLLTSGGHGLDALMGEDAPGGGDHRWFVPLWRTETRWEHYTMFSWGHLRDILNEQVLTSPFGLVLVILGGVACCRNPFSRRKRVSSLLLFLSIAAGFYLLFTLTWNPDYGGQRDWDLFAPAAFPLTLLGAYLLTRMIEDKDELASVGLLLAAASLLFLGAWVYTNAQPYLTLNGVLLPFCPTS